MTKIAGSGSISQWHGSADSDPDPPQNVMDPQHCSGGINSALELTPLRNLIPLGEKSIPASKIEIAWAMSDSIPHLIPAPLGSYSVPRPRFKKRAPDAKLQEHGTAKKL